MKDKITCWVQCFTWKYPGLICDWVLVLSISPGGYVRVISIWFIALFCFNRPSQSSLGSENILEFWSFLVKLVCIWSVILTFSKYRPKMVCIWSVFWKKVSIFGNCPTRYPTYEFLYYKWFLPISYLILFFFNSFFNLFISFIAHLGACWNSLGHINDRQGTLICRVR